jgi:hypothetical protein
MTVSPQPLRFWPSVAATLLAISVCGVLEGACGYGLQKMNAAALALPGLVVLWALTAGGYAANQQ